jgi:hypothetical protein
MPDKLNASDLEMFARFRVPPEILTVSGVMRVSDTEARDAFGIRGDGDMSGIVFPYRDPESLNRATCRLRRDNPDPDGHRKYVCPWGDNHHLYFAPGAGAPLHNSGVDVVLVEAEKSVLALLALSERVGRRWLLIATGGCWGWRGKAGAEDENQSPDRRGALPDFNRVTWPGRKAYIIFDANVLSNPEVQRARRALARELQGRGAKVYLVNLPQEDGINGPDDYIAGHADEEIVKLIDSATPFVDGAATTQDAWPYGVESGRIVYYKQTRDGVFATPLCNFSARIEEEVIRDDGAETRRELGISGTLAGGEKLPLARVPIEKFSGMRWPMEAWGHRAIVSSGFGAQDKLREAIQRLSGDVVERRVYTHTGWRKVLTRWVYLHAGGAVGANNVEVEVPPDLQRYHLPAEPKGTVDAFRLSLRLLDVAPLRITAPLWCSAWRSVLASVFPLDASIFLHGQSGGQKSTLAALFLSHFGSFTRLSLPASWSSTSNLLESRAFTLKDALLVIDEYAPSPMDARELQSKADRVLRAQGNHSGRGRLRSDLTERPTRAPRGMIVSTGESLPGGQSLLARMLSLEIAPGDVDLQKLTELQARANLLPHPLAGFVQWLAPQMDDLPNVLNETFSVARTQAHQVGCHLRVPEAVGHLWIGASAALQFGVEVGAITSKQAEQLQIEIWNALTEAATLHSRLIAEEKPARLFLQVLASLFTQGRAFVIPRGRRAPESIPHHTFLGWASPDELFLLPEATFELVSRTCRDSGQPFPVNQRRLQSDLSREGLTRSDPGHATLLINASDTGTQRVLCIKLAEANALIKQDLICDSDITNRTNRFSEGERGETLC